MNNIAIAVHSDSVQYFWASDSFDKFPMLSTFMKHRDDDNVSEYAIPAVSSTQVAVTSFFRIFIASLHVQIH